MANELSEIRKLVSNYRQFLEEQTTIAQVGDWFEVTTPFLDRHNDHLQFYVRKEGELYRLNDDSYVITDLALGGCDLDTPSRKKILTQTLNSFSVVRNNDNSLEVVTSAERFPEAKHRLIQAMIAVDDMFVTATSTVASMFVEDITEWLNDNDIRFSPRVTFTGKSGLPQTFDFLIPSSKAAPERLLKAINHPKRENVVAAAFAWGDIKAQRGEDAQAIAIINDSESKAGLAVNALRNSGITPLFWSEREDFMDRLKN